jgi:signal transduction histidine kinase
MSEQAAYAGSTLAETRVVRTIIVNLGVSTLIFFGLTFEPIASQSGYLSLAWTVAAVALMFGIPPLLAVGCFLLSLRVLRGVLAAYAVAFVLVVATFLPAMVVGPMPVELSPWPLGVTALGTVAAALVWRPAVAWAYLLLNCLLMGVVRTAADGNVDFSIAAQDTFFTFGFCSIFTALAVVAVRNARAVDAAAARAQQAAASAASAAARSTEESRLDALIHDEIMTALYYASSHTPELAGAVQRQATAAIQKLDALRLPEDQPMAVVPTADLVSSLRAAIFGVSSTFAFEVFGARAQPVPAEVVAAFLEAAGEAARNSLRYAQGTDNVERVFALSLGESFIAARIADDGVGFVPRSVPPHRLGIRVSILRRLELVPGCRARVSSRPGRGTVVSLEWRSA